MPEIMEIAARLDEAALTATAVSQLVELLSLADAYRVQAASLSRRYQRGERRVGVKMGFTSYAKMAQMGIDEVIWGRLTDAMQVGDGGSIDFSAYVHPRVEPEIAFLLKTPLAGEVTEAEAMAAVGGVAPALEIIDSRFRDFKFSLTDVVADNSSSSSFVVGPWSDPGVDLANLDMVMDIRGQRRQAGSSAAILGHPVRSLIAAARLTARAGEPLQAGDIIMAGGATAAEALAPGQQVNLTVEYLGRVGFTVRGAAK